MTRVHVAIVKRGPAQALLKGLKRIETRFYRHKRAPYGRISHGDRVHFKLSGGGLIGTAQVSAVKEFASLTPVVVDRLRRLHDEAVLAPADYWAARRRCCYGVLIWLGPLAAPPSEVVIPRQYGTGWIVLREE